MGSGDETHLPTFRRAAQADPRLSRPHAHALRPGRDQRPPGQGPGAARRLSLARPAFPFPKSARLRTSAQFREVLGRRKAVAGRYFQVLYCRNDGAGARLGIVAGRKAAGIAARRNYARRLVREAFRLLRDRLAPADFVVRVVRPLAREDGPAARRELNQLLVEASSQCRVC